jgi:hypothetical protein
MERPALAPNYGNLSHEDEPPGILNPFVMNPSHQSSTSYMRELRLSGGSDSFHKREDSKFSFNRTESARSTKITQRADDKPEDKIRYGNIDNYISYLSHKHSNISKDQEEKFSAVKKHTRNLHGSASFPDSICNSKKS